MFSRQVTAVLHDISNSPSQDNGAPALEIELYPIVLAFCKATEEGEYDSSKPLLRKNISCSTRVLELQSLVASQLGVSAKHKVKHDIHTNESLTACALDSILGEECSVKRRRCSLHEWPGK